LGALLWNNPDAVGISQGQATKWARNVSDFFAVRAHDMTRSLLYVWYLTQVHHVRLTAGHHHHLCHLIIAAGSQWHTALVAV
jgi:hypothetical protein